MTRHSKIIIGVCGFLIGYIFMSYLMFAGGWLLQPKNKADAKKYLTAFGLPRRGVDPNKITLDIDRAGFLKYISPFYYFVNPAIYLFMPQE